MLWSKFQFLLILFLPFFVFAQFKQAYPPNYIQKHHIKSISTYRLYGGEQQEPPSPETVWQYYLFNEEGIVIEERQYTFRGYLARKQLFSYNENQDVTFVRVEMDYGNIVFERENFYEYDALNRPIQLEAQEEKKLQYKHHIEWKRSEDGKTIAYEYDEEEAIFKISYYDRNDNLILEENKFWQEQPLLRNEFQYNNAHQIVLITYQEYNPENPAELLLENQEFWYYDGAQKLSSKEFYENNFLIETRRYQYDFQGKLFKVFYEVNEQVIQGYQYEYEFW